MGNNLLLNSHPLVIIPELAAAIGLNEAIVLQQIHYWCNINQKAGNNFRDGSFFCVHFLGYTIVILKYALFRCCLHFATGRGLFCLSLFVCCCLAVGYVTVRRYHYEPIARMIFSANPHSVPIREMKIQTGTAKITISSSVSYIMIAFHTDLNVEETLDLC